jgi:hypothetical protein
MPKMQMKDKTISSRMEKTIDDSIYEIIEFNESEPIIFRKDKKKKQQQQLCKTAKGESNKHIILVIPSEFTRRRINN